MLNEHPFHSDQVASECGATTPSERKWLAWCGKAEKLLGHDLDGDDVAASGCGYSLDEAHAVFTARQTPEQYARTVEARTRYKQSS